MNKIDDGGPAFPRPGFHPGDCSGMDIEDVREAIDAKTEPQNGMSLRDHFAGQALAGRLATPGVFALAEDDKQLARQMGNVARDCYRMADAMIAARRAKCD